MAARNRFNISGIDWATIFIYIALVLFGWINIYAAGFNELAPSIFDTSQRYGNQIIWLGIASAVGLLVLLIDIKFYITFTYPIYVGAILLLVAVLIFGNTVNGAKSWIQLGGFTLQPSEFAKFATALCMAKYLSTLNIKLDEPRHLLIATAIFVVPAGLILLQPDLGSAMVFFVLILALYREGMSPLFLIGLALLGIVGILALVLPKFQLVILILSLIAILIIYTKAQKRLLVPMVVVGVILCSLVFAVDFVFNDILQPHQQERINVVLGKSGDDWNVRQSLIAIGSGGFSGKGFLNGTQTKFDFVPEQTTDFIFCTVGEEWGFLGSLFVIGLFTLLLFRLTVLANRQRSKFSRIYGYSVLCIFFAHFFINIAMTVGIAPVIGIPLPFISYGGSSLLAFTILLFIMIKLDAQRLEVFR